MQRAAIGAARVVVNAQDLVWGDHDAVGHFDWLWEDTALPILNRRDASDAVDCLDGRLERSALERHPEREAIGIEEANGPVGECRATEHFEDCCFHIALEGVRERADI